MLWASPATFSLAAAVSAVARLMFSSVCPTSDVAEVTRPMASAISLLDAACSSAAAAMVCMWPLRALTSSNPFFRLSWASPDFFTVSSSRASRSRTTEPALSESLCSPAMSFWISWAALPDSSASLRTSSATTAKPRPASPARAASMAAFRASRFVWSAMPVIVDTKPAMDSTDPLTLRMDSPPTRERSPAWRIFSTASSTSMEADCVRSAVRAAMPAPSSAEFAVEVAAWETSSTAEFVRASDSEFSSERRATSSTDALTSSMEATASSEMAARFWADSVKLYA